MFSYFVHGLSSISNGSKVTKCKYMYLFYISEYTEFSAAK